MIYFFLQIVFPFLIMICCTGVIIWKVIENDRQIRSSRNAERNPDQTWGMSITIVSLNFLFMFLAVPMHACTIWLKYFYHLDITTEKWIDDETKRLLFNRITNILFNINYSINFYLYLITGGEFRRKLWSIITRCRFFH